MDQSWELVQEGILSDPFPDGQEPTLLANRCARCGKTFFPKRDLCPHCFEEGRLENITLDNRGIIYACTVVHIPSPVGIEAPYAYGYVDLPKNQIRIFALFTGSDPSSFIPGQEVQMVVEPVRKNQQGQEVIGYKFKTVS